MAESSELARLREQFPGWEIRTRWVTAGSGPDVLMLEARREGVTVSAQNTVELAQKIREHEQL
jgi:hypothetical protein